MNKKTEYILVIFSLLHLFFDRLILWTTIIFWVIIIGYDMWNGEWQVEFPNNLVYFSIFFYLGDNEKTMGNSFYFPFDPSVKGRLRFHWERKHLVENSFKGVWFGWVRTPLALMRRWWWCKCSHLVSTALQANQDRIFNIKKFELWALTPNNNALLYSVLGYSCTGIWSPLSLDKSREIF